MCDNTRRILNMSARGLKGRSLEVFIADDRPRLLSQIDVAFRGQEVVIDTVRRPRDRQPRQVRITINRLETSAPADLEWLIVLL